jgi:integrase
MSSKFAREPALKLKRGRSVWKGVVLRCPKVRPLPTNAAGLRCWSVAPETARAYLRAYLAFRAWVDVFAEPGLELGDLLEQYVAWAISSAEVSKQQVTNCLACIPKLLPKLAGSGGELSAARLCMDGWRNVAPSTPRMPVPWGLLKVFVARSLATGRVRLAVLLLLGFHCYLRISELLFLRVCDVMLPGDPRLLGSDGRAAVFLRFPKSGRPQDVVVDSPLVVLALRALVKGAGPEDLLFDARAAVVRQAFDDIQRECGFPDPPFVVHCLRHGGASHDFADKLREFEAILIRGRWNDPKMAKHYIHEAQALVAGLGWTELARALVAAHVDCEPLLMDFFRDFV